MNTYKKLCVIIDIDGVVCNSWDSAFKEQFEAGNFEEFEAGIPTYPCIGWAVILCQILIKANFKIIFLTARNNLYYDATAEWLETRIGISKANCQLVMRPQDNVEKDHILKRKLWKDLEPDYDILFALDDNLNNAKLWQKLGVPSLHVLNNHNT